MPASSSLLGQCGCAWEWTAFVLLGADYFAYLVLNGGTLAGLCALVWLKSWKWFKKKFPQITPDDDAAASKKYVENVLSVRNLSKEILNDFPHSLAMQKRILLNLRMVEDKLAELDQFLLARGLNAKLNY